jgi:hypothetical protein
MPSLFMGLGADIAVNNIKVSATEMLQWVPFGLWSSYKILRTAVDDDKYVLYITSMPVFLP